jgi:hypothetical protein
MADSNMREEAVRYLLESSDVEMSREEALFAVDLAEAHQNLGLDSPNRLAPAWVELTPLARGRGALVALQYVRSLQHLANTAQKDRTRSRHG